MTRQIRIIEGDTIIDRDMTADEMAAHDAATTPSPESQAHAAALASARSKLAALGLTDAEVAALLGS